jgi:hypothetical protein
MYACVDVFVQEHNVKMTLNLIDTPGLYERKARDDAARNNGAVLGMIAECMRHEITQVHCVVFFASFETGITKEGQLSEAICD